MEDQRSNTEGQSERIEFGVYAFDLGLIQREARKYLSRCGRTDLIDDVVSDTAFSLLRLPPAMKIEDPDAYAVTATRRSASRFLRQDESRRVRQQESLLIVGYLLEMAERRRRAEKMVDAFLRLVAPRLTERQQHLLDLALDGRTRKEIAAILKADRKTVYNELKRLRPILRSFLDDFDPDDPSPGGRVRGCNKGGRDSKGPEAPPGSTSSGSSGASGRHYPSCTAANTDGISASNYRGRKIFDRASAIPHLFQTVCSKQIQFALKKHSIMNSEDEKKGFTNNRGMLAEFKRCLLDLPAFRDLEETEEMPLEAFSSNTQSKARCDSLKEIRDRLATMHWSEDRSDL